MLHITIIKNNETFALKEGRYEIGRDDSNFIIFKHPLISRKHAIVYSKNGKWYLEDLKSKNGIFLNGEKIKKIEINSEIVVSIGDIMLSLKKIDIDDVLPSQVAKEKLTFYFDDETQVNNPFESWRKEFGIAVKDFAYTYSTPGDFFSSPPVKFFNKKNIKGFGLFLINEKDEILYNFIWGEKPDDEALKNSILKETDTTFNKNFILWTKSFTIKKEQIYSYLLYPSELSSFIPMIEDLLITLGKVIYLSEIKFSQKPISNAKKNEITYSPDELISTSKSMEIIKETINNSILKDTNVIIEGETGVGKDLLARLIHKKSNPNGPFVSIDVNTISTNLIESELFGFKKGAFTGALEDKEGLIEKANGGTLFLDEIENLSPEIQAKLLRVLDKGEFYPIGGRKAKKVNFRVIAASQVPFSSLLDEKKLRMDFYFRIKTIHISIPPLRERKEDIIPIFEYYVLKKTSENNKIFKGITQKASQFLLNYSWPGNVRELKNEAERCVILMNDGIIKSEMLSPEIQKENALKEKAKKMSFLERKEMELILDILIKENWNKSKAAKILGITRAGLIKKLKRWGII